MMVRSRFLPVLGGVFASLPVAVNSFAIGLDLTGITIDTSPIFSVATLIITAIAGVWAIKRVITLLNK